MIKHFPVLYKKSSAGALLIWGVQVEGATIETCHGQLGGAIQQSHDTVKEGKNLGKKNATTPETQAEAEALAKWEKQKSRNGYVEDRGRAEAGESDAEGGIAPMLAQPEEAGIASIHYPCDGQRKYNGNRCIVVIEDGQASMWSRKRKRMLSMPHIRQVYWQLFKGFTGRLVLDGELYRHGWSLQKISGYCRKESTKPGYEEIGHVLYDIPSDGGIWTERREALANLMLSLDLRKGDPVSIVETFEIESYREAEAHHDRFVLEGYEGLILRNKHGRYEEGKRSYNLVKVKKFHEQEFKIVGVGEGRGKFEGKAVFDCVTEEGKPFACSAPGTMEDRAEFLKDAANLIGKHLTVKFFEWSEDKIPVQPVGLVIRDYE